jgi:hypothetical protein
MQILHLFGLSAGDEVWVRVVGMLASIIGFYYLLAVRAGLDQFIPWTVPGRYCAAPYPLRKPGRHFWYGGPDYGRSNLNKRFLSRYRED